MIKKNREITLQTITLAKLELFKRYFPAKEDQALLDKIKNEGSEVQETFITIVERLLCFGKEKRDKLSDSFLGTLWKIPHIKHNWYKNPHWCFLNPFVICTDQCSDCQRFRTDDSCKRLVGWTHEELDWLAQEDEIKAKKFDRKNDIGGASAPIRESED